MPPHNGNTAVRQRRSHRHAPRGRRAAYPDPVEAARIAEDAGASGITVHLRGDRRHIQDRDVERLRETVRGKLNLEMSGPTEMLRRAALRPHQVTLVPERPEEVTTEGGLDLVCHGRAVAEVAERLAAAGIDVSLFVDPDPGSQTCQPCRGAPRASRSTPTPTPAPRDPAEVADQLGKIPPRTPAAGPPRLRRPRPATDNVGPIAFDPRHGGAQHRPLHRLAGRRWWGWMRRCVRCWRRWATACRRVRSTSDITPVAVTSGPAPGPEMVSGSSQ